MSYTALYRKFRPETFSQVRGQDAIVTTLKNQIRSGRIGHAYLFCGTRGTGKTSIAKIFARAVNCEHPVEGDPCGECETCKGILAQTSMNVIEIDAASNNGVDNIREIRDEVEYRPSSGKYKVYIIDEVHMLSIGAFNALLKTLEEPPSYVIFILATTEVHKIPVTILSRCQRYDFRRISVETIQTQLHELMELEHVDVEEKALHYLARAADGSMRDALSLLDQCIAFHMEETLTYEMVLEMLGTADTEVFSRLLRRVYAQDAAGSIHILEELILKGKELGQFVADFTWYMRNLLLAKSSDEAEDVLDVSEETMKRLMEERAQVDTDTLMRYIRVFSELSGQIRYAAQKRVLVEIALIKLCRPAMETELDALLDRVRSLEKQLEKLEQAPAVFTAQRRSDQPAAASAVPGTVSDKATTEEKKPEKAAPEDLQRIQADWKQIVGATEGMLKQMLRSATPKYDGNTGEARLFVEFTNPLAQNYVDHPEGKEELQEIIRSRIGKDVDVEMLLADREKAGGRALAKISVDDILKQEVHMDITIEDEQEES